MPAPSLLLLAALVPLSTASVSPPDVWSVNVGGSGDFVDIQPAVDHALPGDTILVWGPANGHQQLRSVTITKGLTVIGLAPEYVRLEDLHVRDVPADQAVTLVNLSVGEGDVFPSRHNWANLERGAGALVEECAGPVVFRGCSFRGGLSSPGGPGMRVVNAEVALLDCKLEGGALGDAGTSSTGISNMQHALVLQDARALVAGSELLGADGSYNPGATQYEVGGRGGDGVRANGESVLWLLDSSVSGGAGWDIGGFFVDCYGGDGGDGVRLGPDAQGYARASTIEAGAAGWGSTDWGRDGEDIIGNLALHPGVALKLKVPTWARDIDVVEVIVRGEPGATAYLGVGDAARFRAADRAGVFVADGETWIPLGALPPSGKLTVPVPLPAVAAGGAVQLVLQTAFREPTGLALGEARALIVVDERWLPDGVKRVHVDGAATPGGDGLTWGTAFDSLRMGLEAATGVGPGRTDVWVHEGLYVPVPAAPTPIEPFFVKSRTHVFGGFAGTETELSQRDPALHPTVLSGDVLGDDTDDDSSRGDNSRLVLAVGPWEPREDVRLDGFVVRSGHAAKIWGAVIPPFQGCGIELSGAVDVVGCNFVDNRLGNSLRARDGSDLRVIGCRFLGNRCGFFGSPGGFGTCRIGTKGEGLALFANCEFSGNTSLDGAGILAGAETFIVNCTFYGNVAGEDGGAVNATHHCPHLVIENSILWRNFASKGPDIYAPFTWTQVRFSLFDGGATSSWGSNNVEGPARLADPAGPDGVLGTLDDDLTPLMSSPAVDAANNAFLPPDVFDLDGDGDITEGLPFDVVGNPRQVDDPNVPDTGSGAPPIVDMGSRERQ